MDKQKSRSPLYNVTWTQYCPRRRRDRRRGWGWQTRDAAAASLRLMLNRRRNGEDVRDLRVERSSQTMRLLSM